MMTETNTVQKEGKERVRIIDAIRGFSLLGILMANMLIFQYGLYGKDKLESFNPSAWDIGFHKLLQIMIEGSFMPIFMFLFGYGLYKMKDSLVSKGLKYKRYLSRRFLMLLLLGVLHGLLLWEGDILAAYGLMGFCLLLFIRRKPRTMLIWGIVLSVLFAGLGYGSQKEDDKAEIRMKHYIEESIDVMGSGTYMEIQEFRMNADPLDLSGAPVILLILFAPVFLAPMFLFGMAAASKQWFHNPRKERSRYSRLTLLFLPAGLTMKTAAVLWSASPWSGVLMIGGGQLLALGYIFLLAFVLPGLSRRSFTIAAFESVGRMSLTNYLMQTVICTTIFYGYGLGLYGRIGVVTGILLSLLIYAVQAVISAWVWRKYQFGPVERLLRMWTYFSLSGKARPASSESMTS
ncbi:DUF418 domain-containing protein [Paenibacillus mendelii]|uniref:DUF418 domain-containing protein n=1 Tax=Paenibacillus mendelii TaxID=206163 RepID=A0ABV6JJH5_9BACL|nr:DUF418 domain-containing protein [Paenibacillus mendelii]MCQ6563236.1 DUF418 domain-containing protein [Paenibacillus mendelii]